MAFVVTFMDAGQGDATLLEYPDGSLVLVDCGSKKNMGTAHEQISMIFKRRIYDNGNRLKALVLTHPDGDHYNLIDDLIKEQLVDIDAIFIGGQIDNYNTEEYDISGWLRDQQGELQIRHGDDDLKITLDPRHYSSAIVPELSYGVPGHADSVETRILAANVGKNPNDMSIVLAITYRGVCIFLMGDATKKAEKGIIDAFYEDGLWLKDTLDDDNTRVVLKAGHHGSATSSSPLWSNTIRPHLAFISSDTREFGRNGTSLPRKEVVDRILASARILDRAAWDHFYVDYDSHTEEHEQVRSTKAVFTTLHRLEWQNHWEFTAHGTSWYLTVGNNGSIAVVPAGEDPNNPWATVRAVDVRPPK